MSEKLERAVVNIGSSAAYALCQGRGRTHVFKCWLDSAVGRLGFQLFFQLFFNLPFKYIFLHVLKIVGESRLFLFHHFDFACNRVISWDRHGENLEVIFYFNLKAKLLIELMDQQHSIYTACNFYSLAVPQGAKLK